MTQFYIIDVHVLVGCYKSFIAEYMDCSYMAMVRVLYG